jgi:AGCS family alanine or glycine:cation symporter
MLSTLITALITFTALCLLCSSLYFTYATKCIQLRGLKRILRLIKRGVDHDRNQGARLTSLQALFTAMGTTLGMGTIVAPAVAIMIGGPGAAVWLVVAILLSTALKYVEVTLALATRTKQAVIGQAGPMRYLSLYSSALACWYGALTLLMLTIWSALQANTLARIMASTCISPVLTATSAALFVCISVGGGARLVGKIATLLVPLMTALYTIFALVVLYINKAALCSLVVIALRSACSPAALAAGGLSAFFLPLRAGMLKGAFITEAGLGTATISHSLSNARHPTDQGLLAMYAMVVDCFLCTLSACLALIVGVDKTSTIDPAALYHKLQLLVPAWGSWILAGSVALLVATTIMGNSFNARQTFAWFTKGRYTQLYVACAAAAVFTGALVSPAILWTLSDALLAAVALPHLCGLVVLFRRYKTMFMIA